MARPPSRNRTKYLITAVVVVGLGLASRRYSYILPDAVTTYAGDTLWAVTAFLGIAVLFPRWTTLRVAMLAMLFAVSIEVSQLYHSPWLDHLRHTRVGALILGQGFLWSDIICYAAGVGIGTILDLLASKKT
jgi:hypothetical protein